MLNDPKYDIKDGRLWHREGKYYVPDEEPIMVLRGKDPVALTMIAAYLMSGVDESHRASATERYTAFLNYQRKYPHRTRIGCHLHGDETIDLSDPNLPA